MIIPTLNEAENLGATLRRLKEQPSALTYEVIVSDGGSTDGTPDLARRLGARVITGTRGRARQMNAGARCAEGETFYFLHADTLPPPDWLELLSDGTNDLPGSFRLRFAGQERLPWLRWYSFFTRFDVDAFRFGDQSLWVTRRDFLAVGGFPDDWQLLEDNHMVRQLRRHRGGFRILPANVVTSPRKYQRYGFVYTQLVYTLLYSLYRLGTGQRRLGRIYRLLLE
ncbi:TIGR04283 family arsenosugar biosynthesis glycosyltransferase [Neolewinella litorea]|uniref:TIGR04283 family arsenosugar biosynthesis glycosyltransferase n=1 Tax=Neolewinella litorea TaxID=2562452 RepID=UPI001B3B6C99|nr:TIGR04283 family arsenosugar biosynthesis glycosyltransferase [Neolewinella litorea]